MYSDGQRIVQRVSERGADGCIAEYRVVDNDGKLIGNVPSFQNGPVREVGLNGISEDCLTAILIDRYESYQAGRFACDENARVLDLLKGALVYMEQRRADRIKRNVEGENKQ